MNGDDERDYDEEAAVQRDLEVEGLSELAAERAEADDGHMSGPAHYLEAERLLALNPDMMLIQRREDITARAHVHATLSLAAATAANIRRNGALAEVGMRLDEVRKSEGLAEQWFEVLG